MTLDLEGFRSGNLNQAAGIAGLPDAAGPVGPTARAPEVHG